MLAPQFWHTQTMAHRCASVALSKRTCLCLRPAADRDGHLQWVRRNRDLSSCRTLSRLERLRLSESCGQL